MKNCVCSQVETSIVRQSENKTFYGNPLYKLQILNNYKLQILNNIEKECYEFNGYA